MAKSLCEIINRPYEGSQTYRDLSGILNKAEVDISFWGTRCITVKGYNDWCPIDDLVARVDRLVEENYEFTEEERTIGNQLVDRICELEEDSKEKLKTKWFWTRIFVFIREFHISSPRDVDMYSASGQYHFYTREQYKQCFGSYPIIETYFKNRSHGKPDIWKAPSM